MQKNYLEIVEFKQLNRQTRIEKEQQVKASITASCFAGVINSGETIDIRQWYF